jgi:SAM-dependent methyltransferase
MRRLAGALAFALLAAPAAAATLSIRNVTGETVRFRLKTASEGGDTHTLAPGQILRLDGDAPRGIFFQSAGREREYRLESGGSYSFRYDHARQLELFLGSHGRDDAPDLAPFVATPIPVARRMLEMAGVTQDDLVVDLGCGDGRLVVEAARRYGARGLGVDLDPRLVAESRQRAAQEGVEHLVEFRVEDATTTDLRGASVLALYLLSESLALLRPSLERQLDPGDRVVSHNYEVPGWTPAAGETLRDASGTLHFLYLYVIESEPAPSPTPPSREARPPGGAATEH